MAVPEGARDSIRCRLTHRTVATGISSGATMNLTESHSYPGNPCYAPGPRGALRGARMINTQGSSATFEAVVTGRFGILPNFFRSAQTAPELLEHLWGFAKAGYLDNPIPSIFKERLFVWLSRYCPMRYCIVRHVGFLLGKGHGFPAGDAAAGAQTIDQVINLLRRPSP